LTSFDETLARLAGPDGRANNTDYGRRPGVTVVPFDCPESNVKHLNLGCVLPTAVPAGSKAYLVCKARAPGDLRVVLTDGSGHTELATLFSGPAPGGIDGIEGLTIRQWTADVKPGHHRVRWEFSVPDHGGMTVFGAQTGQVPADSDRVNLRIQAL